MKSQMLWTSTAVCPVEARHSNKAERRRGQPYRFQSTCKKHHTLLLDLWQSDHRQNQYLQAIVAQDQPSICILQIKLKDFFIPA
jgi:hypothetical protein